MKQVNPQICVSRTNKKRLSTKIDRHGIKKHVLKLVFRALNTYFFSEFLTPFLTAIRELLLNISMQYFRRHGVLRLRTKYIVLLKISSSLAKTVSTCFIYLYFVLSIAEIEQRN